MARGSVPDLLIAPVKYDGKRGGRQLRGQVALFDVSFNVKQAGDYFRQIAV